MSNKTIALIALSVVIAVLGSFLIFNSNTPSKPLETVKAKIGYLSVANSLPLFVALEKGYFKEAGLEIEPVKFEAPNLFVDAIASGQIDATAPSLATGIMSILETKNPSKFQIFGGNYSDTYNPSDVVVIPADSTATQFSDLKGKTCVVLPGPQFKLIFNKLAKDAGLKPSEQGKEGEIFYKELAVSEQIVALSTKNADCIVGLDPIGTIAQAKGVGKLLGKSPISNAFGGSFFGGISAVNSGFKNTNPSTTSKIVKAIDKAVLEVQTNPVESKKYLAKYIGVSEEIATKMNIPTFHGSKDMSDKDFESIDIFLSEFEKQSVYPKKPEFRKLKYTE
jgi:NitT/TauT family transport system substrate-binding protein